MLRRPAENERISLAPGTTHGVDVNGHEAHLRRFFRRLRKARYGHVLSAAGPAYALVELAIDQIRQVVLDITFRGEGRQMPYVAPIGSNFAALPRLLANWNAPTRWARCTAGRQKGDPLFFRELPKGQGEQALQSAT